MFEIFKCLPGPASGWGGVRNAIDMTQDAIKAIESGAENTRTSSCLAAVRCRGMSVVGRRPDFKIHKGVVIPPDTLETLTGLV